MNLLLCVGFDFELLCFFVQFDGQFDVIFEFCWQIVDVIVLYVSVFKLQIVYFVVYCVEDQFECLIVYIYLQYLGLFVIFDVKCGDIGSMVEQYVCEVFECYCVDVVIVNLYMGYDLVELYFEYEGKGVIVLCCMLNLGGLDLQFFDMNGWLLYQVVVDFVVNKWNVKNGQFGFVVGVMFLKEIEIVCGIVGDMLFLIFGIGVQGGDVQVIVNVGCMVDGIGMMINLLCVILYVSKGEDFVEVVVFVVQKMCDMINVYC